MKIKIDKINLEEFVRLQEYIGRESNRYETTGSCYTASEIGLKASIVGIDGAHTDSELSTTKKTRPIQIYEGVNIEIVDGLLNKSELEELVGLVYKTKKND